MTSEDVMKDAPPWAQFLYRQQATSSNLTLEELKAHNEKLDAQNEELKALKTEVQRISGALMSLRQMFLVMF